MLLSLQLSMYLLFWLLLNSSLKYKAKGNLFQQDYFRDYFREHSPRITGHLPSISITKPYSNQGSAVSIRHSILMDMYWIDSLNTNIQLQNPGYYIAHVGMLHIHWYNSTLEHDNTTLGFLEPSYLKFHLKQTLI